jgi:redox-sensing transcriptional repressor
MNGVPCYSANRMKEIIQEEGIQIGIITVPAENASQTANELVAAGIKGLLNYTPKPIDVPEYVYLEEYDMITTLEKVAFYVKTRSLEEEESKSL